MAPGDNRRRIPAGEGQGFHWDSPEDTWKVRKTPHTDESAFSPGHPPRPQSVLSPPKKDHGDALQWMEMLPFL